MSDMMKDTHKKVLHAFVVAACLYIGSYAVNSYTGGYDHRRYMYPDWNPDVSTPPNQYCWRPRLGVFPPRKHDLLGAIHYPLYLLDIRYVHKPFIRSCIPWPRDAARTIRPRIQWHPRRETRQQRAAELSPAAVAADET